ncbi:MAG TPA: NAD/NADP octopine/nopaline dehydrogenase family protein [Ramlibacter sp.]|nr:NAD/NADP octopine/nopaline dehydrogenase family protein [Ramlibacter sp.]
MTRVAVIGNTHRNLGAACAADLALAGHEVHYAVYEDQRTHVDAVRRAGGLQVQGEARHLYSQRTGFARLAGIHDDPRQAVASAEVVLLDVPVPQLKERFAALLPALPRGAVVYIQSHGYWPVARLLPLVQAAGRTDLTLTEAAIPPHVAALEGHVLTAQGRRAGIEIAAFPASRTAAALQALRPLFPDFEAASSILQTGLESMNLIVHPAMALLGVGLLENAEREGRKAEFYRECNVPAAGRLADALDAERQRVCAAYGVRQRNFVDSVSHYYGTSGRGAHEAVSNCQAYQGFGAFAPTCWKGWEEIDVPYAIVPLVRLAEKAGVPAPLHRSMAEIFGVLLGLDPWTAGPALEELGLQGSRDEVVARMTA